MEGNLKHIRIALGFNQEDMTEFCGLDLKQRTTYRNYETGKTSPTLEVLKSISTSLSIPIDDLIAPNFPDTYSKEAILGAMARGVLKSKKNPHTTSQEY